MVIVVNGTRREVADGAGLPTLLEVLGLRAESTIVERNGTVVDRAEVSSLVLHEGDVLELVRFVGGG